MLIQLNRILLAVFAAGDDFLDLVNEGVVVEVAVPGHGGLHVIDPVKEDLEGEEILAGDTGIIVTQVSYDLPDPPLVFVLRRTGELRQI